MHRLLLCGLSDLAEIAIVRAIDMEIEIVGFYDRSAKRTQFLSKPVWIEFELLPAFDVAVVTDLTAPLATVQQLRARLDSDRVVVPDMLRIE